MIHWLFELHDHRYEFHAICSLHQIYLVGRLRGSAVWLLFGWLLFGLVVWVVVVWVVVVWVVVVWVVVVWVVVVV